MGGEDDTALRPTELLAVNAPGCLWDSYASSTYTSLLAVTLSVQVLCGKGIRPSSTHLKGLSCRMESAYRVCWVCTDSSLCDL